MAKSRPDYIAPQDLKYVGVDPDPDFDPEGNKRIIEGTIKWTDRVARQKTREAMEKVKERIHATALYASSISRGGKSINKEKFFGKKNLAYLRGYEIMERIKGQLMLQGRDKLFVIKPSERAQRKAGGAML